MPITPSPRIYTPIALGLAIILAVVVLRPLYLNSIDHSATLATKKQELNSKETAYNSLLAIKNKTNSGSTDEIKATVKKLGKKFDTSSVMEIVMLNDFTRSTIGQVAPISISSIAVNKGTKLPSGLSLWTTTVSISAKSIDDIIRYITYLTTQTDYVFTIDSISLPIDTSPDDTVATWGYSMGLTLGIYYYE